MGGPAPDAPTGAGFAAATDERRWVRAAGDQRSPLLAVCGLCGGAGASTLAYLLALFAARAAPDPVLVCDTGRATAGLAHYAGLESPRSLIELAERLADDLPLAGGLWVCDPRVARDRHELRIIATRPRSLAHGSEAALERLLGDAQVAHALTVVDCGTLERETDRTVLRRASHVAWTLPATVSGARRAQYRLAAMPPGLPGREIVVARRDTQDRAAALKTLKALAASRRAPLVLMPHIPDLHRTNPDRAFTAAQVPLQALLGLLDR